MKKLISISFFLLLTSVGISQVIGELDAQQDTTAIWNITTADGNEYNGNIMSIDKKKIVLKTTSIGTITILKLDVQSMTKVDPLRIHNGQVWLENSQESRYFWSPSSYGIKKGKGYFQNVWIMFNHFGYGITDNFTIGIGTVPLFLFAGTDSPVWITPKFSIPIEEDKLNIGGGAFIGTVLGSDVGAFGIAYGTSTFGSREKNMTIGLGYGFYDGDWSKYPTITLSGMIRTGKRGYFITENYLVSAGDDTVALLMLGGRKVWRTISLDYGGVIPTGSGVDRFVIIPWLGILIPFGS